MRTPWTMRRVRREGKYVYEIRDADRRLVATCFDREFAKPAADAPTMYEELKAGYFELQERIRGGRKDLEPLAKSILKLLREVDPDWSDKH